jgi:hypothetical protein
VWSGVIVCLGRMARERTITPRGAIVHFLSVFDTLEKVSVNDHPRGANIHFLSRFGTLEESSANDRPWRCDRSLPQCV